MERTWRFIQITGLLALGGWWLTLVRADEQPAPEKPRPTRIALIDMARLFNAYPLFNQMRDDLKTRIESAQAELNARTEGLKSMQAEMRELPVGSPERKKLEREIRDTTAKIEADKKHAAADFFQREAGLYSTCYRNVRAEVIRYVKTHDIQLVLRFTEPDVDKESEEPAKVMERLQRQVVYHAGLDITDEILAELKARPRR